jgi:NAD(P)-dependent dehydrogenase (short-subunit alcohol dehydrogenase family)
MARELGAVLITGASSGIGRATALELDRSGFRVFAGIRKPEDAERIREQGSERLAPVRIDIAEADSIAAARDEVEGHTGSAGLTGLVNNAGIANGGPIEHLPIDAFRRVIEVNLTGQLAVTQAFLPLLRAGEAPGRIVFNTSIGGRVAYPFMSPYHASKFGLEGAADSLRRELLPWGIKVIVIEPGSIATEIWEKGIEASQEVRAQIPAAGHRQYGEAFDRFLEEVQDTAARGIPSQRVARVIRRALTRPHPGTRYRVGLDARLSFALSRMLGDRLFDRVVARVMKLPSEPPG